MFDFGERLKELRESRGLTQEEMGKRVGRSKSVICSYEGNIKFPPMDVLSNIALLFNVSTDYLVGISKAEMLSLDGLTKSQCTVLENLVEIFRNDSKKIPGLSIKEQETLNLIMKEFMLRD